MQKNINLILSMSVLILFVAAVSCKSGPDPTENIKYLNGFWEIKEAYLPDGTSKNYTNTITVDYIEVEGSTGVKKKVVPVPTGGFTGTSSEKEFVITVEEESLWIYYTTDYDSWKEKIINVDAQELRVLGKQGITYVYKRYDF